MASTDTENVVGAAVFFAYIAGALVFTSLICWDLLQLYNKSHDVKTIKSRPPAEVKKRRGRAQVFIALSTLSFAVLSYHMLNFLVISYTKWSQLSEIPLPAILFGNQGIFDFQGRQRPLYLWLWSKRSTLFQTFAETIINDPKRYWWTQQALLYSLGWNIFMAVEGIRYQIPNLWMYFVLDQILPISFTQNLFCTAVYLTPNLPLTASLKAAPYGDQIVVSVLYMGGLSLADSTVGTPCFFFVFFGIRGLLFAPYWMLQPTARGSTEVAGGSARDLYGQYRYAASVLAMGAIHLQIRQSRLASPLMDAIRAIRDDPSVSALGYDYVVAVLSLVAFIIFPKMG